MVEVTWRHPDLRETLAASVFQLEIWPSHRLEFPLRRRIARRQALPTLGFDPTLPATTLEVG